MSKSAIKSQRFQQKLCIILHLSIIKHKKKPERNEKTDFILKKKEFSPETTFV